MIIIKNCQTILIRFANVTCWSTEDLLEILSPRKSSCCNSALASCSIVSSTLASESARSLCPLRMAATVIILQYQSSSHLPTLPGAKGLPHRATWWRSWRSMVPWHLKASTAIKLYKESKKQTDQPIFARILYSNVHLSHRSEIFEVLRDVDTLTYQEGHGIQNVLGLRLLKERCGLNSRE